MITLYTPATGYPELDLKIAYGMCRLGLEAGARVVLHPEAGYYRVSLDAATVHDLQNAWSVLASRVLSSSTLYLNVLPAFDRASLMGRRASPDKPSRQISEEALKRYGTVQPRALRPFKGEQRMCGHDGRAIPKFAGGSLPMALAPCVGGRPRDRPGSDRDHVNICDYCGHLAVLGSYSFCANIRRSENERSKHLVFTIVPAATMGHEQLSRLLAAQRRWPEWLSSKPLPAECVPLVFATHACSFATAIDEGAILVGTAYEAKRQARIEASFTARLRPFMSFVDSAYNAATVQRLVERRLGKPGGGRPTDAPAVGSLVLLSRWLLEPDPHKSRQTAVRFARTFSAEMSATGRRVELLYPATSEYMLGSDDMLIPRELRESEAVRNVADMLRYFVEHRNYGYVDQLTRATEEGVRKHLIDALRQARSRRVKKKDESHTSATYDDCTPKPHFVPLPEEDDIREVSEFLEREDITLEMVTSTLALLALTRRHYEGEDDAEDVDDIDDNELPDAAEEAE